MKKFITPYLAVAALIFSLAASSCNDDSKSDDESFVIVDNSESSVMVSTFNLVKDDSVLANLDSVFFSINLDNATIFNADSLPVGTKTNSIAVKIGLPSLKKAEITMPNALGTADTVVNYLTNSATPLNFSRGKVNLYLQSLNGEVERNYTIYVNVHKTIPDSLVWTSLDSPLLPTPFTAPNAQRTILFNGKLFYFTQQDGESYVAMASNPQEAASTVAMQLPGNIILRSITAAKSCIYALTSDNDLIQSSDAITWTSTGAQMTHIYGTIDNTVIGVSNNAGTLMHTTYPASAETAIDASCPVEGTSDAIVYTTSWSTNKMLIVSGGTTASGSATGSTWAYDGNQWAEISIDPLPAISGAAVVPYYALKAGSEIEWRFTEHSVLLLIGGQLADGTKNQYIYISYDLGVHWVKAPASMQSEYTPTGLNIDAIVFAQTLSNSRAVTPITEWSCPYIYVYGSNRGYANNPTKNVYRGVINKLSYKPLQ